MKTAMAKATTGFLARRSRGKNYDRVKESMQKYENKIPDAPAKRKCSTHGHEFIGGTPYQLREVVKVDPSTGKSHRYQETVSLVQRRCKHCGWVDRELVPDSPESLLRDVVGGLTSKNPSIKDKIMAKLKRMMRKGAE